jgi:hypothetical protein
MFTDQKTKDASASVRRLPHIANWRTKKIPQSLEEYLEFFALFQNLHIFIPLMMFREILGGNIAPL